MTFHPFAYRLLKVLGLSMVAAGCDDGGTCGDPPPTDQELLRGCTVSVAYNQESVEYCGTMALEGGMCPAADSEVAQELGELQRDLNDPESFGAETVCGPKSAVPTNAMNGSGECCYVGLIYNENESCPGGRPLLVDGAPRVAASTCRADWLASLPPLADSLSQEARRSIANGWLRDAATEHASVASFARFTLELLGVGAPASLVADAQCAALDEIEHARLCYAMAARYGAGDVGPGALDVGPTFGRTSLIEAARAAFLEGCVGETQAAFVVGRARSCATDAVTRDVLETIAQDEERHAALAWRFVAWALKQGGEPVRAAISQELDRLRTAESTRVPRTDVTADVDAAASLAMRTHGRLGAADERAAMSEAIRQVILPCALSLLAGYA